MSIEIVSIGNEILRGRLVNTNAAFLSRRLTEEGWSVTRHTTLPDEGEGLTQGLRDALNRSSLVITTGGLGPTLDDITLSCAQTLFPNPPTPLPNPIGTASGALFTHNAKSLILLPGVPQEMELMWEESVVAYLRHRRASAPQLYQEDVHFCLLREDAVDPLLRKLRDEYNLDIGIYPSYGVLTVVLRSPNPTHVLTAKEVLIQAFRSSLLFAPSGKPEEAIHLWMQKNRMTLAFAESCTGGFMASQITALPGSSDYFLGSLVTYSNRLKEELLGVPAELLQKYGAVSREVTGAMWSGLLVKTGTEYGIAVSGIAGPGGGTPEKPVGTIWYALGRRNETPVIDTLQVKGNRSAIILRATQRLLALFCKYLDRTTALSSVEQ